MKKFVLILCLSLVLVACGREEPKPDVAVGENPPIQTPANPVTEAPETTVPDEVEQPELPVESEPEKTPAVEPEKTPAVEPETAPENSPVEQEPAEPVRTPEQQLVDKELIMLLREQLAGAYDTKGATFTFTAREELEGKECFAYEMKKDGVSEIFAVAVDSSAIFHLEGKEFVKIFG